MAQVTCHACQAYFEVDFAPGTQFTCGACGATLQVPAAPVAPTIQPRSPSAPLGRAKQAAAGAKRKHPTGHPTARPLNAPRPPVPTGSSELPKSGLHQAIGKDKSKQSTIMAAAIGGGILLIAIIVAIAVGSGNDDPGKPGGGGDPAGPGGGAPKVDAYTLAYNKAYPSGPLEDVKRLGDMAWQRHQSGQGSPQELRMWESHWRWACRRIISFDKDNALAHERLGDVLFDLSEAEALVDLSSITEDLKDDIRFLIEEAEDEFKALRKVGRIWLSTKVKKERDLATRWKEIQAKTDKARGDQAARATDSFYSDAEALGNKLAKQLASGAVDFRIDGTKSDPFVVYVYKPYVYLVQRSSSGFEDRIARKWNDVLQALRETFYRLTGDACGVPQETRPTPVVILNNGQEYTKYRRMGDTDLPTDVTSVGHFEPATNRLVCFRSGEDAERSTLFHEGTHQIVNWAMLKGIGGAAWAAALGKQSFWFSEGIGDYYGGNGEAYEGGKKVFVPGKIHVHHVDTLVAAKARGALTPIEKLLDYTRADFNRDNIDPTKRNTVLNGYSHGWALCYLLQNWKKDKYGAKWNDYAKEEFRGRSGKGTFTLVFGSENLAAMQQDFNDMIDALGQAKKDGKIVNGEIVK